LYRIIGNQFQRNRFHDDGHAAFALPGLQLSPRLTSMPSPTIPASPECEQKLTKATKELPLFVCFVCFCSKKVLMGAESGGHQSAGV